MARKTKAQILTALRSTDQPTQDGGWAIFWANLEDWLDSFDRPYKVYTALLTQSGTSAPVATVLENTLGGTVVWTRSDVGTYAGTLSGAFTADKTFLVVNQSSIADNRGFNFYRNDANSVALLSGLVTTGQATDEVLSNTSVEIRVYD